MVFHVNNSNLCFSVGERTVVTIIEMTETDQNYPQIPDGGNQVLQSDKLNGMNGDIHELKMLAMEKEMEGEIGNLMIGPNLLQGKNYFKWKKTFFNLTFDSSVYGFNTLNFSHTFHLK